MYGTISGIERVNIRGHRRDMYVHTSGSNTTALNHGDNNQRSRRLDQDFMAAAGHRVPRWSNAAVPVFSTNDVLERFY